MCHVIWHVRANVFSIWGSCHLEEEEVGSVEQEGGVTLICHWPPNLSKPGQYKFVLYPYLVGQKPGATFICHCHPSWCCSLDSKLTLNYKNILQDVRSPSLEAMMVQLAANHLKSFKWASIAQD